MNEEEKTFIKYFLYDGRYLSNPEKATCYEVCNSFNQAKKTAPEYGSDTFIVRTKIKNNVIIDSKIV